MEEEFQKSKAFLAKGLTPVDIMSFMGQVPERAETLEQVIGILTEGMPAQEAKELIYIESSSIVELLTGDAEKYAKAQRLMSECKDKITPDNLISASFLCEETSEKEFDKVVLDTMAVSQDEFDEAIKLIPDDLHEALVLAHDNIFKFHKCSGLIRFGEIILRDSCKLFRESGICNRSAAHICHRLVCAVSLCFFIAGLLLILIVCCIYCNPESRA